MPKMRLALVLLLSPLLQISPSQCAYGQNVTSTPDEAKKTRPHMHISSSELEQLIDKPAAALAAGKTYTLSVVNNLQDADGRDLCIVAYRIKSYIYGNHWGPWVQTPRICRNCKTKCANCWLNGVDLLTVSCMEPDFQVQVH